MLFCSRVSNYKIIFFIYNFFCSWSISFLSVLPVSIYFPFSFPELIFFLSRFLFSQSIHVRTIPIIFVTFVANLQLQKIGVAFPLARQCVKIIETVFIVKSATKIKNMCRILCAHTATHCWHNVNLVRDSHCLLANWWFGRNHAITRMIVTFAKRRRFMVLIRDSKTSSLTRM